MTHIFDTRKFPTCVDEIPSGAKGVHESCLRSYQILQQVKYFLKKGTPTEIVLELISEMEADL